MAFKFAARALLELGKELISSDEVAINELVKNAIDAGSPSVHLVWQALLTHRDYEDAHHRLDRHTDPAQVLGWLESRLIGTENEKLKEAFARLHQAFLQELRASTSRRDAFKQALRTVYQRFNWIEVRDKGHGMSASELDEVYLTVGTRSRRRENIQGAGYLGDKGVGRLSTMRLGEHLLITTTRNGERTKNELEIDWLQFGHDVEADVSSITIAPRPGEAKADRTDHGTTVKVSALLGDWTAPRLMELLQGPIARMIDPFQKGRANELLRVEHNGTRLLIPSIPEPLLEAAHATCKVSLTFAQDGTPKFDGMIDYRLRDARRGIHLSGVEVYSLVQEERSLRGKKGHAATQAVPIRPEVLKSLGPFNVEVYWYNRLIVQAIPKLTEKTTESREQVGRWAGGLMLYRHGFRVLPYGDPDDDWLELDKKAFGRSGFKLNRQQVIGRVTVRAAHTALSEQTNREGLVESPESAALRRLLMWLLDTELRSVINEADEIEKRNTSRARDDATQEFRQTETKVIATLAELRGNVPAASRVYVDRLQRRVEELAEQASDVVAGTEKLAKEAANDREQFVHLAGIGLMTEFIFHELDRSVSFAVKEIQAARRNMPSNAILKSLEVQLATLHKRISAFDDLSGEKRQVKTRFDVTEVVTTVTQGHAAAFKRHQIALSVRQDKPLMVQAVKGMLIQILENLITNSEYWLKQQQHYEEGFEPRIHIEVNAAARTLSVSDNGPGVDPERAEIIFHPFVSSKPANGGRGLGLYISRELAAYHDWKLAMDAAAPVVRAGRLNTFLLDVSGGKQ